MAQPTPLPVPLEQTREHVIQQLCEHFAYDNLTSEALEERLDRAHQAATLEELRSLVSDLPVVRPDAVPAPGARTFVSPATGAHVSERQIIVGIMGGAEKKGVWTPAKQIYVVAMMGGAHLDFREARFGPGVTEVIVFAIMGGAEIVVPPGVHVDLNGVALMGGLARPAPRRSPPTPTRPCCASAASR